MILDDEGVRDQAMIDFLKNGNKGLKIFHKTDNVEDNYVEASLKEAYVVKKNDIEFPNLEGSILAVYKFDNRDEWEAVKTLELETSIEGRGELEEVEDLSKSRLIEILRENKEALSQIYDKNIIEKLFKNTKKEDEMNKELLEKNNELMERTIALLEKEENSPEEEVEATEDKVEKSELEEANKKVIALEEKLDKSNEKIELLLKKFEERETPIKNNEEKIDPNEVEIG